MSGQAKHAFISHSSRDATLAMEVTRILEDSGVSCWIAPRDIPDATDWAKAIPAGIDECAVFLFLLTEHSASDNKYVKRELLHADKSNKTIFGIRCGDIAAGSDIEFLLGDVQWSRLNVEKVAEDGRQLARKVIAQLGVHSLPVAAPVASPVAKTLPVLPVVAEKVPQPHSFRIPRAVGIGVGVLVVVAAIVVLLLFLLRSTDAEALYLRGRTELANGNVSRALADWRKAATRGHQAAALALGKELISGRYGDDSWKEGAALLEPLAKAGNATAREVLDAAINPLILAEDARSLATLKLLAETRIAAAEFGVAVKLLNVDRSDPEGVAFLKRAAQANHREAMRELGRAYFEGKGVAEDNRQARDWMRKAAALGDTSAKDYLLQIDDYIEAEDQYERDLRLANSGDLAAKKRAAVHLIRVKKEPARGAQMLKEAADAGSADATSALAECYLNGWGVPKDRTKSIELYKKAADMGSETAKHNYEFLTKPEK
jgi:TPR repeat protein